MYKINKGNTFKCIKTLTMDDGVDAYLENEIYVSDVPGCITDAQHDPYHYMLGLEDFYEHFERL